MCRSPSSLVAVAVALSMVSFVEGAVTEKGVVRQPRNIYELIYSFQHTFRKVLKDDELDQYRTLTPQQMREKNPALYERISRDVKGWTDEWLREVTTSGDQIPSTRLKDAIRVADGVDAILRGYFDAKQWTYKPMRVVFLPPRLFLDEGDRQKVTSGMFIPFYPDAFFVTVDWPVPIELVLVHESLHFNASIRPFGGALSEGITETASRYLVRKYDLLTEGQVNRADAYPRERKGVEFVLEEIMKRTSRGHDEALELLLAAYLTGSQDEMKNVFGSEAWERVLRLSDSTGDWQTHRIAKALGQ